jgi:hypothetical protein
VRRLPPLVFREPLPLPLRDRELVLRDDALRLRLPEVLLLPRALDLRAPPVLRDPVDFRPPALRFRAAPDPLALRDPLDLRDPPDLRDPLDFRDPLDLRDPPPRDDSPASARSVLLLRAPTSSPRSLPAPRR